MPRLKIKFLGGSVMLVLFFCSAFFMEDNKELKVQLEQQLTTITSRTKTSSSSMRKHSAQKTIPSTEKPSKNTLNCPAEFKSGDIEPKEFFVFHNNLVWCNVFKSASTSVLYIMGLLENMSVSQLKRMKSRHPLVSQMRSIYGRPSLQSLKLKLAEPQSKVFIVKRHPFQRLFSGFNEKIIGAIKGSYHDKMAQKILETYRGIPKNMYKFKVTVPTFAEFVEFILDEYDRNGEVDMHWAPVVDFCSVCQVNYTHVLDFEHLHEDMSAMLPEKQDLLAQLKVNSVRLNVNKKHPVTQDFIKDNLKSLGTTLYQRLCHFYAKDFQVFGYSYPNITFDT